MVRTGRDILNEEREKEGKSGSIYPPRAVFRSVTAAIAQAIVSHATRTDLALGYRCIEDLHSMKPIIWSKGGENVNCIQMDSRDSWHVVNHRLNTDHHSHTESTFRLAFALSCDSSASWCRDYSFWSQQRGIQTGLSHFQPMDSRERLQASLASQCPGREFLVGDSRTTSPVP